MSGIDKVFSANKITEIGTKQKINSQTLRCDSKIQLSRASLDLRLQVELLTTFELLFQPLPMWIFPQVPMGEYVVFFPHHWSVWERFLLQILQQRKMFKHKIFVLVRLGNITVVRSPKRIRSLISCLSAIFHFKAISKPINNIPVLDVKTFRQLINNNSTWAYVMYVESRTLPGNAL